MFKLCTQAFILFTAQKILAFTLPASLLIVYILQTVYMRTSRQLQLLELESRAAVFSSFLESVSRIAQPVGCTKNTAPRNHCLSLIVSHLC